MGTTTGEFIAALTAGHDVIVIGGLAVIAHGYNRPTKDADIWWHPMDSPCTWAAVVEELCSSYPGLSIHTLPDFLREFAADGDPFSQALLEGRKIPDA